MPSQAEKADTFLALHHQDEMLLLPNPWDVVSARIFEEAGFPALATTSAGIAATLGYADNQHIPKEEMRSAIARIVKGVRTPVTADIEVVRPLEWMDTDAAGIWHHSTALRFAEDAERRLHDALGLAPDSVSAYPRVHVAFDFHAPVRFGDHVTTTLTVVATGTTSMTYRVTIAGPDGPCATGKMIVVHLVDGVAAALPTALTDALAAAGSR
ncbi:MAG: isocitrate lyase/phosphoenolpyruvate mutase family protein [Planctomycetes bacterium]|nr:isocitrate lyase/phosphoenolpyruvate mutase family protein [Planctomycetota bacterium]